MQERSTRGAESEAARSAAKCAEYCERMLTDSRQPFTVSFFSCFSRRAPTFINDGASFVFGRIPARCNCFFVGRDCSVLFSVSCFIFLSRADPIDMSEGASACCGNKPAAITCLRVGRVEIPLFNVSLVICFSSFAATFAIFFFASFFRCFDVAPVRDFFAFIGVGILLVGRAGRGLEREISQTPKLASQFF